MRFAFAGQSMAEAVRETGQPARDYPTTRGAVIYNGYWKTLDRIINYRPSTGEVEVEALTAVNGKLILLDRPEPARTHSTRWDPSDRIVTLPEGALELVHA